MNKQTRKSGQLFPVVGIGASAGGLEAVTKFLEHLPRDTGLAFVLVQHLDPTHESKLTELLGRATQMPVLEVRNGMRLAPDRVYVIPPNRGLVMDDGRLQLTARGGGRVLPVDAFLKSLAEARGSRAIGVILSGTASDGAEGVQAIKTAGGITFAQDEKSAKYTGMPAAAVATGGVDFVLPPELIARELAEISRHPYVTPPTTPRTAAEPGDDLQQILRLLLRASGVDFTQYKPGTIQRRIQRRMALHKIHKLSQYAEFLQSHAGEAEKLHEDLLIAVTGFFRDPAVFQVLRKKVFPQLLKHRQRGEAVRIWVPGCSTGEEAYSVAIMLLEHLGGRANHVPFQIFATDISDRALAKARAGVYPASIATAVGRPWLRRYFTEVPGGYQINKEIRERCIFAKQNLAKDPPFSNLDLISCRNVLIYLGPVLQQRVLSVFHYALKPYGRLVLGASESITGFQNLFSVVDKTQKVFAKKPVVRRAPLDFRPTEFPAAPPEPLLVTGKAGWRLPDIQKEADRLLATRFAPASVLINDECEILQFRGHTGTYLEPASGTPSLNLLKMAREGLLMGLRPALAKARQRGGPVRQEALRVKSNGTTRTVNIEIVPLKLAGTRERHWLVLFEEPAATPAIPAPPVKSLTKSESDQQIAQLEQELAATKEYMRSVVEDYETANEELKAANEEVQSSNEELQSTNEELETAKEELQSTNEELTTVNEEVQSRNAELSELNAALQTTLREVQAARDYAEAIVATTRQPLVVLDGALRVQTVNAAFLRMFQVTRKQTVGRLIYELGRGQWDIPALRRLLEEILPARTHFDGYRVEHTFPKIGHRAMLLNACRLAQAVGQPPLILLGIEDITEQQRAAAVLRDSEERLRLAQSAAKIGTFDWDLVRGKVVWQPETERLWGLRKGGFQGSYEHWRQLVHPEDLPMAEALARKALADPRAPYEFEHRIVWPDGTVHWIFSKATTLWEAGQPVRMVGLNMDITERKQAEQALREAHAQLEQRVRERTAALQESEATARTLLENPIDGIYLLDRRGTLLDLNETFARRFRRTRQSLLGRNLIDIFPPAAARHRQQKLAEVLRTGKPVQFEDRYGRFWLEVVMTPVRDGRGRVMKVAVISRDITARKQTELARAHLAAIVESSTDAITTMSLDGVFTGWNAAAERLYGYRAKEVIGKTVTLIVPPDRRDEIPMFLEKLRHGEEIAGYETVRMNKRGRRIPVSLTISPVRDAAGRIVASSAVARDISERKRLEAEIQHISEIEKQRLGRDLHDGLTQQLVATRLLASGLETALARKSLPESADAAKIVSAMSEATQQAHDLARGLFPVELQRGDIVLALKHLAATVSKMFKINCQVVAPRAIHLTDTDAARQMYRIAQEAVNNAIKHSRGNCITVQLVEQNGRITLTVQDDGVGISHDALKPTDMGLRIMRYRAGILHAKLTIARGTKGGTLVTCVVPHPPPERKR